MSIQNLRFDINGETNQMNNNVTFEIVVHYVKKMGLEDNVTVAILNKARKVPPGALGHFLNNINTYIANITRETHHDKQT